MRPLQYSSVSLSAQAPAGTIMDDVTDVIATRFKTSLMIYNLLKGHSMMCCEEH